MTAFIMSIMGLAARRQDVRVQEYIHSHICEEIDIDELSEVACISQAARAVLKFILFS